MDKAARWPCGHHALFAHLAAQSGFPYLLVIARREVDGGGDPYSRRGHYRFPPPGSNATDPISYCP